MRYSWIAALLIMAMVAYCGVSAQAQMSNEDLELQMKKLQQQIAEQQAELMKLQNSINAENQELKAQLDKKADLSTIESLKLRTDKVKIGGDIRLRGVSMDDVWDFGLPGTLSDKNDSWDYYRFRNRLWFDVAVSEDIRGYIRLVNEYRWGDTADTIYIADDPNSTKDIEIDNAFIEIRNLLDAKLTLKIGRQDLIYGEGLLVLDGTPWDGSRTIGFDAIKATLDFDKTIVDIFMAKSLESALSAGDDEDLYGVYLTNTGLLNNQKIEAYVLHKNNDSVNYTGHPAFGNGKLIPEHNTTAVGTRLSGKITDDLTYAGEIAMQWRSQKSANGPFGSTAASEKENALGGYIHATYTFNELDLKPALTGGFTYLDEDWDDMFGRWPKYSELLIYTFWDGFDGLKPNNLDPNPGVWNNMFFPSVDLTFMPMPKMQASLGYKHLFAIEERQAGQFVPGTTGGTGDNMGDLVQAQVKYKFTDNLSSHALLEFFNPGDYYPDDAENAYFARWQLMLSF